MDHVEDASYEEIIRHLARVAFEAYNEQAGGKTWDGKDIPPFSEVGDKVQANWIAAVSGVINELEHEQALNHRLAELVS